jgi:SH3 domain protein
MVRRWLIMTALFCAATVSAQTRYVTDNLSVELRRGPSLEYLILRSLRSGEAVQVLEQDAEAGYSRVRAAGDGAEGWVLTRFLENEPAARDKLAAAERNLAAARNRVTDLEGQVGELTAKLGGTEQVLEQTEQMQEEASAELADIRQAAANVIEIREQNDTLRQSLAEREADVERLQIQNSALRSRDRQNWFVVGACVLLGGILLGLIAPTLRRRRRTDW